MQRPLRFEPNVGQFPADVRALARHGGATLVATDAGPTLTLHGASTTTLGMHVRGGRVVQPELGARQDGVTNYYRGERPGSWHEGVAGFGTLTYPAVLDGVSLVFHGEEGQLEYDFVVAPGTDPAAVVLEVSGSRELSLTAEGQLAIHTPGGDLVQPKPRVYQRDGTGSEILVEAEYRLVGGSAVGFEVAAFDRARELVIDPVLSYGTYFGGTDDDTSVQMAIDGSGNALVSAATASTDVPVTVGSLARSTGTDVMIAKFSPTGVLVYATYLGGSGEESPVAMGTDGSGNAYVLGGTDSLDFAVSGVSLPRGSLDEGFLAKLSPTGQRLYATYVGGDGNETARALDVTADGVVVIVGDTSSTDFPLAASAVQGSSDAFVATFDAAGTCLLGAYVGGTAEEQGNAVTFDPAGNLLIAGTTSSDDFPLADAAFGRGADQDGFVAKLSPAGIVAYSTYLGGAAADVPVAIASDGSGNAILTGQSASADFPVTAGAREPAGSSDVFLTKLSPDGASLFSTCLGGTAADSVSALRIDASGNALLVGNTSSTNLPTTAGTLARGSGQDAFVASYSPTGAPTFVTYLGGAGTDDASCLALDPQRNVFVGGQTGSSNFPITIGSLARRAGLEGYVAKISPAGARMYVSYVGGNGADSVRQIGLDPLGQAIVAGFADASGLPTRADTIPYAGAQDLFVARLQGAPLAITPDSVTVTPLGSQTFEASGEGEGPYTFSMAMAPSGGTVDENTGAYTAGRTGGVVDVVRATRVGGSSVTANVTVTAGVSVTAGSPSVAPSGTTTVTAAGGTGAPFTYTVAAGTGATVDPDTGLYTAGTMGNVTDVVTATDSLGNFATVEIGVGSAIVISPAAPTVSPLQSVSFGAVGGSGTGYVWSAVTPPLASGGSIAADGAYVAGSVGNTVDVIRVTDSLGNRRRVNVTVGPNLSIVQPNPSATTPRGSLSFSTAGGHGGVKWTLDSAASGGTIVSATGEYVAGPVGGTTDVVRATDDLSNTATLAVEVGAGVSIAGARGVAPRESLELTATGGSGTGFVFSFAQNESSGTLVGKTYTAGSTPNRTDSVVATDSLGNVATVSIVVGPGVTIAPATAAVPPNGSFAFSASGGKGPFTWSIQPAESGSPTISGAGAYVAGATGNCSDVVIARDTLGNTASVAVSVGGGLVVTPVGPLPPRASVTLAASGGTGGPYTWSALDLASGGTISAVGVYRAGNTGLVTDKVRVTDALGNKRDVSIAVTRGVAVAATPEAVAPRGSAALTASGGSGTGFTWAFVTNGSGATVTAAGSYKAGNVGNVVDVLQAKDSLGNVANTSVTVTAPLVITPPQNGAPPNGELSFAASGGAAPYRFSLQVGASGGNVVDSTGHYRAGSTPDVQDVVAVTDANGVVVTALVDVGAGVSITPSVTIVSPNTSLAFVASGGSNTGFVWAMITNASTGSVDPDTGLYLAGPTADVVDVVRVTDSLLNSRDVSIVVGAALVLTPTAPAVAPRQSETFAATGGSGEYQFTLFTNASGATIDQGTGVYVAGATPNVVDRVKVADRVGNQAFVDVAVGAGLVVSPATLTLAAGATTTFAVEGGSGTGFVWSLAPNGSGAALDPATGSYVAGAVAGQDGVRVTDSLGNVATATVTVTAPPSAPDGGGGGADAGVTESSSIGDSGCTCHTTGGVSSPGAGSAILFGLALLLRRKPRS